MPRSTTRRRWLAACVAGALAGCLGSGDGGSENDADDAADDQPGNGTHPDDATEPEDATGDDATDDGETDQEDPTEDLPEDALVLEDGDTVVSVDGTTVTLVDPGDAALVGLRKPGAAVDRHQLEEAEASVAVASGDYAAHAQEDPDDLFESTHLGTVRIGEVVLVVDDWADRDPETTNVTFEDGALVQDDPDEPASISVAIEDGPDVGQAHLYPGEAAAGALTATFERTDGEPQTSQQGGLEHREEERYDATFDRDGGALAGITVEFEGDGAVGRLDRIEFVGGDEGSVLEE